MKRRHGRRLAEALGSLERFRGVSEDVEQLYAERARAIRDAFKAGAGISAIADRLGIPRSVVYRALDGNTKGEQDDDK